MASKYEDDLICPFGGCAGFPDLIELALQINADDRVTQCFDQLDLPSRPRHFPNRQHALASKFLLARECWFLGAPSVRQRTDAHLRLPAQSSAEWLLLNSGEHGMWNRDVGDKQCIGKYPQ